MGCGQTGAKKAQFRDTDGRIHAYRIKEGKLLASVDGGAPEVVRQLAIERTAKGVVILDGGARGNLTPKQFENIKSLAELASVPLAEATDPQTASKASPPGKQEKGAAKEAPAPPGSPAKPKAPQRQGTTDLAGGGKRKQYEYSVGDWVKVYSVSRARWIGAQITSIEGSMLTVSYQAPDGTKEKRLPKTHEHVKPAKSGQEGPDKSWQVMGKYSMYMGEDDIMGEGSSSICRKGVDNATGKPVAIKVYKSTPDFAGGEDDGEEDWETISMHKYTRQIEVLLDLGSPMQKPKEANLWSDALEGLSSANMFMQLVDYSRDTAGRPAKDPEDGLLYVITELAQYSLLDFMNWRKEGGEALSKDNVRGLAKAICQIVAGLHVKGYVHLDLKPENMMIFDGSLKLIDVDGCIKIGTNISLMDPSLSCSPVYCAPEWAEFCIDEGDDPHMVLRPHLDVWSVGMTICELVTLEPVLLKQYTSFYNRGQDVGVLFMEWLCKQTSPPMPRAIEKFDPQLAAFLTDTLLVCDATCRQTLAQALCNEYLQMGADQKRNSSPLVGNNDLVLTWGGPAHKNRAKDRSDRFLHKGMLWKLNTEGDPMDPNQWLRRDMWIAGNGSLCYFSLKENERLVLVDAQSLRAAQIKLAPVSAKGFSFELTWRTDEQMSQASAVFACDTQADHEGWIAALDAVKGSALKSLKFGAQMAKLRLAVKNRRQAVKGSSAEDYAPVFKGMLWKLKAEGNRTAPEDWFEREMWIAKNGSFVYWSKKEEKDLIYYTPGDVSNATLKKIPNEKSARPWTFQVHITSADGFVFEPGEFAAESKEARERWMTEFKKFSKSSRKETKQEAKEVCVDASVTRLGFEFQGVPPETVVVSILKPGLWAQTAGIKVGDEICELNGVSISDMTNEQFLAALKRRPLKMSLVPAPSTKKSARKQANGTMKSSTEDMVPSKTENAIAPMAAPAPVKMKRGSKPMSRQPPPAG